MNVLANKSQTTDDYPTRLSAEEWSDRKDLVVWTKWSPDAPLTQAQEQSYADNG